MFKEFKEFAMKGNVADMAVGIIIGAAFGAIVKSLVDDVLMPPLGMLLGGVDFTNFFLVAGRCQDGGCRNDQLRYLHQQHRELPDRRVRGVLARAIVERHEEAGSRSGGHDQGMPVLRVDDSSEGSPLSELHVTACAVRSG
jgi:hypothetical protein